MMNPIRGIESNPSPCNTVLHLNQEPNKGN